MEKKKKLKRFLIAIDDVLDSRLRALSYKECVSKAEINRQALKKYLDEKENQGDEKTKAS